MSRHAARLARWCMRRLVSAAVVAAEVADVLERGAAKGAGR